MEEDDIDLSDVALSHYRVSIIRQQDLKLQIDAPQPLEPANDLRTATAKNIEEAFLSQIIARLNELFITDHLTDKDMVNYAYTIRDKISENTLVMKQIAENTPQQAMLGDFPKAIEDAIMESGEVHQNQMMQLLSNPVKSDGFAKVIFDLLTRSV